MKIRLLFISLFICMQTAFAAEITLSGNAPHYRNQIVSVFTYTDYISFTQKSLGEFIVAANGDFSFTFSSLQIVNIYIELGALRLSAFVEPGKTYQIALPPKRDLTDAEKLNPYFKHFSFSLFANNSGYLNEKILQYDSLYFAFLEKDFKEVYFKHGANGINRFATYADSLVPSSESKFFDAYKRYKIAGIKHLARPTNKKLLVKNYLQNQPVLYDNPAYFDFLGSLYKNYFITARADSVSSIFVGYLFEPKKFEQADSMFTKLENIDNTELRYIIYALALTDGFYNNSIAKGKAVETLETIAKASPSEYVRGLCSILILEFKQLVKGADAPEFKLLNIENKTISLQSFKGKFIYLNFVNSDNYVCLQELGLLKTIYAKYIDVLEIVSIFTDANPNEMVDLVKKNNYNWVFAHYKNDPDVLKKYKVKVQPSYFLISPEGKILWSPAYSPQEDFENKFTDEILNYKREQTRKENR